MLSACAVAMGVDRDAARGAAMSAPPTAAMVSFLRRFFNVVPFAARASKPRPPKWACGA